MTHEQFNTYMEQCFDAFCKTVIRNERELVDKIIVHAPDKSSGHRVQRIDIHYKFIGEIELSPEYSKYIKKTTA